MAMHSISSSESSSTFSAAHGQRRRSVINMPHGHLAASASAESLSVTTASPPAPRDGKQPRKDKERKLKPLTIQDIDVGFFLATVDPFIEVETGPEKEDIDVEDAGSDIEDSKRAAPTGRGLRAPPPTPMDPFTTPPPTPVRALTTLDENSPESLWGRASLRDSRVRRVKKEMKIVQMLGPEAAGAAKDACRESE